MFMDLIRISLRSPVTALRGSAPPPYFHGRGVRPCRVPDSHAARNDTRLKSNWPWRRRIQPWHKHSAASFEQREPGATAGEAVNVDSADLKNVLRVYPSRSGVVLSRLNPKNVHGAICGIRSLVALSRNPKNILGPIPVDLDSARNASEPEKCLIPVQSPRCAKAWREGEKYS